MKRALTLMTLAACAGAAHDATAAEPVAFDCRASAAYAELGDAGRVEPLLANGVSSAPLNTGLCADEDAGVPALDVGALHLGAAAATTRQATHSATASVAGVRLGGEGFDLRIGAAETTAAAICAGTTPTFAGTSKVAAVRLDGRELQLPAGEHRIDLGALGSITFNEREASATALVQRAVDVRLAGSRIVLAESRVSRSQNPCATPNSRGGQSGGGVAVGADGGVLDAAATGGRVVAVADLLAAGVHSPCLNGPGPSWAIVGTPGADHLTGTVGRDRILGLGGADRLAGGNGADCVDGGAGRDIVAGSIGRDRLWGRGGRDALAGGSGADVETAGRGADTINAGSGSDRVLAGRGRDVVNAVAAGRALTVRCGSGHDTARVDRDERRRTHGCERTLTIR